MRKIYAIPVYHNSRQYGAAGTYAFIHGQANGNGSTTSPAPGQFRDNVGWRRIYRTGMQWDLTAIPTIIGKANAKVAFYTASSTNFPLLSFIIRALDGATLQNPMVNADYGELLPIIASHGSGTVPAKAAWDGVPTDVALNASGLADIIAGLFFLGFRGEDDINNIDNITVNNTYRYMVCGGNTALANMLDAPVVSNISVTTATVTGKIGIGTRTYTGSSYLYLEVDGVGDWSNCNYRVAYRPSGGAWQYTAWQTNAPWDTDIVENLTGLIGGTVYDVKLQIQGPDTAIRDGNLPPPIGVVNFTTLPPVTVVTDPVNVVGLVTLNGRVTGMGLSAFVDVEFEWGLTVLYGNTLTGVPPQLIAPGAFSAPLPGLTPGITYHCRAKGTDDVGAIVYGADQAFTPTFIIATTVAASPVGRLDATLHGTVVDLGSSVESHNGFEWGTTGTYGNFIEAVPETLTIPDAFSALLEGLAQNTLYYYRSVCVDEDGHTGYGAQLTFKTGEGRAYAFDRREK